MASHLESVQVGRIFGIPLIGAFKLFIIDKDGGHDLEATYRLLGGCPFHQEVLDKKSYEPNVLY